MPLRVQPIYADSPGPIEDASYTLPASLDLELSSIRARIDGSGAADDFIVVAELLTSDGRRLAQSPISQTLSPGDTGAFTWAPFLRSEEVSTPPATGGLPFAVARTNTVSVSSPASGDGIEIANFAPAVSTFVSNDAQLDRVEDVGHTPLWGISIPADKLVLAIAWLQVRDIHPLGTHRASWLLDGSYTITQQGPGVAGIQAQSISAALTDDETAEDTVFLYSYLSDTADFVLGTAHVYEGYTNDPLLFRYGLAVTIIGDRPT